MSNPVRFDPVLVRALAAELSVRLAGRSAHPLPVFDSDLSVTLGGALRWELHPSRGWVLPCEPAGAEASARVARVSAPADERLLRVELLEGSRFRGAHRTLVFELHGNQWNALVVDGDSGRIVSALRAREAGGRRLVPGAPYAPPAAVPRTPPDAPGAGAAWDAALAPLPPGERAKALVRHFAWTSPLNAATILGDAARGGGDDALQAAFGRWRQMAAGEGAGAHLLRGPKGVQPYPYPLDGWEAEPCPSLLGAMTRAAAASVAAPDEAAELVAAGRRRLAAIERRIASLRGEQARSGEAERLRGTGDLILAHLHLVRAGMERIALPAFEGGVEAEVALDPTLRPHENAERYYADARRRARAEARVPELILAAEAERRRWADALALAEAGEPPAWLASSLRRPATQAAPSAAPAERLPYRPYRTSGGLEVRVGKTSKDNDRLTFHHASPGDVWLHARSVPGSHVVLRWTSADAPPARDLEEAAVLAALYSKARTSGTVAVDWTRRKHVRKPRGAPPGRVSLLHAKTLFVAPDPAVEERMRRGPDEAR